MRLYLLLAGLISAATAHAERTPFQIRCEDTIAKTVSVLTAANEGYTVDITRSYLMLTQMAPHRHARNFVLGLTSSQARVKIGLSGSLLKDKASGYECIAPHIDVALSYAPIVVYVGREFPVGTCAYREILAHEMRHLKANFDHLPKVELVVRAALAKRFEARPLYAPAGRAQALLQQEINTGWMPYVKAEMAKVQADHAEIDRPEEYARLSKVCQGEVQSVLSQGRRLSR